jgi:transcriptional regulator with XRE-family HTH domain
MEAGIMRNSPVHIGTALKALRERSGFTQSNVAKYLKVDQSLISKFETGERALTADMLEKLAALFGVDLTAFEGTADHAKPLTFALRASEINEEDMDAISAVNRIALNCNFMTRLLEDRPANG